MRIDEELGLQAKVSVIRVDPSISSIDEWLGFEVQARIRRFEDEDAWRADRPYDMSLFGAPLLKTGLIVDNGGKVLWKLLRGDTTGTPTPTPFNNANSALGIGNLATAVAVAQTNMQGTPAGATSGRQWKALDSTYPAIQGEANGPTGNRQVRTRATFGSADGNLTVAAGANNWREFGWANGRTGDDLAAGATMLDRFLSDQGVKVAGQVWELTIDWGFTP